MKKISIAILFALLIAVKLNQSAFAENNDSYEMFEQIAQIYDQYGEFDSWPQEGYEEAIDILETAGVIVNDNIKICLNGVNNDISKILDEYLPGNLTGFINRVIESVWGDPAYWSLYNKCWYTEFLTKHNLLSKYDRLYKLPDKNDYSTDDIRKIAMIEIERKYGISENMLNSMDTYYSFYAKQTEPNYLIWKILFCEPTSKESLFSVELNKSGEIISCYENNNISNFEYFIKQLPDSGRIYELSIEKQAELSTLFSIPLWGIPTKDDISEDQARKNADRFLIENETINYKELDEYDKYTSFPIHGKDSEKYPLWEVYYVERESNLQMYCVKLSAKDGSLLLIEKYEWNEDGLG